MYCRNCGSQQPNSAKICSNCGCELKAMISASNSLENEKTFSTGSKIFIAISLSFLAIIIGWASYKNYEKTGSITADNSSKATTTTIAKESSAMKYSNSSTQNEKTNTSNNQSSKGDEKSFEYTDTLAVLNDIKSNHSEFSFSNLSTTKNSKGVRGCTFNFKISDIEYNASGMNSGYTDENGSLKLNGHIAGCQIMPSYDQSKIDKAGGIDAYNEKIIDETLYLVYSPYLSKNKSSGIKDVIASKLKSSIKFRKHIYDNPEYFLGNAVQYGEYIYTLCFYINDNNDPEIWYISIDHYANWIGPELKSFHGKVLTDNDINSASESTTVSEPVKTNVKLNIQKMTYNDFSLEIDTLKWYDLSSSVPGFDCLYGTNNSAIFSNALFSVITQKNTDNTDLYYFSNEIKTQLTTSGYDIQSNKKIDFNGYDAYKIEYYTQGSDKSSKMNYILFIENGCIYLISYGAEESDYDSLKPEFDKILSSFRVR